MAVMNIYQRLHAVMGEVDYIQKEKRQGMRYSIVSHDAVTAKVRPILVKHGVIYYPVSIKRTQNGNRTEVDMIVRFVDVEAGEWIEVATGGYGLDDQDKGIGKAISYAVKYALLKALGLETGDEPEEDQETTHRPDAASEKRAYVDRQIAAIQNCATDAEAMSEWKAEGKNRELHFTSKEDPEYLRLRKALADHLDAIALKREAAE